jgi:AraC-like DNA-binding protein
LTERPVFFAETPHFRTLSMDAISEVLKSIKLEGALFFNAELSAPWCLVEPHSRELVSDLSPGAGHLLLFHYVLSGQLEAGLSGGPREKLSAGDIVIIPHGDSHILTNGKPENPVNPVEVFGKNLADGLKLTRYGGGGEVTRLVCGYLILEPSLGEAFLSSLPKLLTVRIADDDGSRWIADSIKFSVGELGKDNAEKLVVAKLSEVLFVETLRRYINSLPPDQAGLLAASRDPAVGRVIELLHSEPEREWTVSDLARRVGVSRTRLSERFREFLGDTPMAYLAKWRLRLGADLLASTERSVSEVAVEVGYASESAFNRAFKKQYQIPPAQYRRKMRVGS